MKRKSIVFALIIFVVLAASIGSAFAFGLFYNPSEREPKEEEPLEDREEPAMMSIEEGLQIAEQYRENEYEIIEYTGVQKTDNDEYLSYDSDEAAYKIRASSGLLNGYYRKDIVQSDEIFVSENEAEQVARKAVAKYRSDFNLEAMTKTVKVFDHGAGGVGYTFEWRLYRQGVDIGHAISVDVTGTGEFIGFICSENIDFEPDLSKVMMNADELKTLALDYMKSTLSGEKSENIIAHEPRMIRRGEELFWEIELETMEENSDNPELPPDTYYYLLIINAQTGEIVDMMAG